MAAYFASLLSGSTVAITLLVASSPARSDSSGLLETMINRPAVVSSGALSNSMLGVAHAGQRIVAVGDRGVILLSDDGGASYRQAKRVPTRATLTSVCFSLDGKTGWAAGHWGVILNTIDGGETWKLQRHDATVDRPLFTIAFTSPRDGYAAGLWSLYLQTRDGGRTWKAAPIGVGETEGSFSKTPRNLLGSFSSVKGTQFLTAEQGALYRSVNQGESWVLEKTSSTSSFWTGIGLRSGTLLAAGLGGSVIRSIDDGVTWTSVASTTKSSITGIAELSSGQVVAVGVDGLTLTSRDDGRTFVASFDPERTTLTAIIEDSAGVLKFTSQGPALRR